MRYSGVEHLGLDEAGCPNLQTKVADGRMSTVFALAVWQVIWGFCQLMCDLSTSGMMAIIIGDAIVLCNWKIMVS